MKNLGDSIFSGTIVGMILGIPIFIGITILAIPFLVISCITDVPMSILLKNLVVFAIAVFWSGCLAGIKLSKMGW